jgi:hypothetical protein
MAMLGIMRWKCAILYASHKLLNLFPAVDVHIDPLTSYSILG